MFPGRKWLHGRQQAAWKPEPAGKGFVWKDEWPRRAQKAKRSNGEGGTTRHPEPMGKISGQAVENPNATGNKKQMKSSTYTPKWGVGCLPAVCVSSKLLNLPKEPSVANQISRGWIVIP